MYWYRNYFMFRKYLTDPTKFLNTEVPLIKI